MNGKEISEEQVDEWVAEAERGYDVEMLRRRGRPARGAAPSEVVTVRLTHDELEALSRKADQEHLNRSDAIREALRLWSVA